MLCHIINNKDLTPYYYLLFGFASKLFDCMSLRAQRNNLNIKGGFDKSNPYKAYYLLADSHGWVAEQDPGLTSIRVTDAFLGSYCYFT